MLIDGRRQADEDGLPVAEPLRVVLARKLPLAVMAASASLETSSIYERPSLMATALRGSRSTPRTSSPASAKATASGRPT